VLVQIYASFELLSIQSFMLMFFYVDFGVCCCGKCDRKTNNVSNGLQASQQHRSQPSQQSFSQGLSSQQGILSHFSQSSLDEAVTANDQVRLFSFDEFLKNYVKNIYRDYFK
jgi:hypothetical protein